jgi:predicted phosphodiesterase
MRIAWDEHRDCILKLARESATVADLVDAAYRQIGCVVTEDMVRSAWRRWQQRWGIPEIGKLVGADVRQRAVVVEQPPPAHLLEVVDDPAPIEFVIPKEAKPPEIPVDSSAIDKSENPKSVLYLSDVHVPIHDERALAAVIAFARDRKPEVIVVAGDFWDCWLISSHDKEADRLFDPGARLQEEFDIGRPILRALCDVAQRVHFIPGNHENRISRLIKANPGLFGLRALEWKTLADMPDGVTVHQYGTRLRVGLVNFVHGDRLGGGRFGPPKHAASWVLDNQGNRSVVFGHTHRLEQRFKTVWDESGRPHQYVAINGGHLSDVSRQKYVNEPNWQHGCVFFDGWSVAGKPRVTPHLLPIVDGRFSFDGRVYDGNKNQ